MKLLTSAIVSASMLAAAPSVAFAQTTGSASKLSVVSSRAGAPSGQSKLLGAEGSGGIIALALLAGIVAIGVLAATQNDNNNNPNSP